jgi:soluble lytic murein transglycosylase-like protein
MSAPRRWARRAVLALAGSGLTAVGFGGSFPGGALGAEASAGASESPPPPVTATDPQAPAPTQEGSGTSTTTSTTPAPSGASGESSDTATAPAGASTVPAGTSTAPAEAAAGAGPTVVVQRKQQVTTGRRTSASVTRASDTEGEQGAGASKPNGEGAQKSGQSTVPAGTPNDVAPAPLAAGGELLPQAQLLTGSAVSAQALDFFRIPLFLLPIYQAAAFQYDVPWPVLAAVNEVETDYGSDLSLSTAGAEGWMQFMPATWLRYGVDATDAGYADPYNPVDAIFAAARYLHAAGASQNLHAAILAYNHSQEYVESVLLRARLIASYPRSVIGTLTGLADGRAPTAGARVGAGGVGGGGTAGSAATGLGSSAPGTPSAAGGSSSATAGAVPLSTAPTPADAAASATAGIDSAHGAAVGGASDSAAGAGKTAASAAGARPGLVPAPPPQVAARRAEAAANAPAKPSQLVELLGAPSAPVVAVQNGRIVHLGRSRALGRYVVLRDIYGDVFTYAGLGSIAPRYRPWVPALERAGKPVAATQGGSAQAGAAQGAGGGEPPREPAPTLPATAGHQPPVTLRVRSGAARAPAPVSGRAVGASESEGEPAPPGMGRVRLFAHPDNPLARTASARASRSTSAGNGRWVALRSGSIVSEGTVLGHLDTPVGASAGHLRFAVRPAGDSATIDAQPLLSSWRQLGTALHPRGSRGPGALLGATAGGALLMSKGELERAVLADVAIQLDACARRDVAAGAVDGRVLAVLEFLSRSGLQPTVAGLECAHGDRHGSGMGFDPGVGSDSARAAAHRSTAVEISAINGVPIAGHQGRGSITDATIRTLLTLRGRFAPHRIVSLMRYPEAPTTEALPSAWEDIQVDFLPLHKRVSAHAAAAGPTAASPLAVTGDLNAVQWGQLFVRIAALPKPTVAAGPSSAAIGDPQAAPTSRDLGAHG